MLQLVRLVTDLFHKAFKNRFVYECGFSFALSSAALILQSVIELFVKTTVLLHNEQVQSGGPACWFGAVFGAVFFTPLSSKMVCGFKCETEPKFGSEMISL